MSRASGGCPRHFARMLTRFSISLSLPLFARRVSATSEKPDDLVRKAAIALKRKEKESLEEQLQGLRGKKEELTRLAGERRETVSDLLGKIDAVSAKLL